VLAWRTLKGRIGQLNMLPASTRNLGSDDATKLARCRKFAAGTYTDGIGPGSSFFTLADNYNGGSMSFVG